MYTFLSFFRFLFRCFSLSLSSSSLSLSLYFSVSLSLPPLALCHVVGVSRIAKTHVQCVLNERVRRDTVSRRLVSNGSPCE